MTKGRETSAHRAAFGVTGHCMPPVSDVRLEIPCWLLDIESFLTGNTFSDTV